MLAIATIATGVGAAFTVLVILCLGQQVRGWDERGKRVYHRLLFLSVLPAVYCVYLLVRAL